MAEAGESPPVKQSALSKLVNRIRGRPTPQPQTGEGLAGTRTTEQIQQAKQNYPEPQPQERVPAPGDPDYKPLTKESPVYEPERQAQLRYAAQQTRLEQDEPTSSTQTQPEQEDTNKPIWLQKEEARLGEGYAKEAISQVPQTAQESPAAEQPATTPTVTEQVPEGTAEPSPAPTDAGIAKVLDTPVKGEHKEVEEFLKTQPKPTSETTPPVQPEAVAPPVSPTAAETSVQIPVETTQPQTEIPVPVEATAPEEKPIPVSIQAKTPVSVGVAEPVGKQSI
ncbi:hypothetical protein IID21_02695 [Patescibacteria group bacterium]|nr:hypothetical protein [Patescibacteria group bacterium]